jgi:TatA/E family protein of Tat protein translocase
MPFHPIWAVVVIVIVLILFGVGRLSGIGEALGKTIVGFRQSFRSDDAKPTAEPKTEPKKE